MNDAAPSRTANETDPLPVLEADLAAVDAALASLDRIELEGRTGDAVVAEINAVVDPVRFDQPAPGSAVEVAATSVEPASDPDSDLVGDGFVDEQVDSGSDLPGSA